MSTPQQQDLQHPKSLEPEEEEEEAFSFPVSSTTSFIESPRLLWRRVPITANSSPTTRLEVLRSKYQRRSFSCMEIDSFQMMIMATHDPDHDHHLIKGYRNEDSDGHDLNKMDLLWEDLHELPKTKKYLDDDDDEASDLDDVGTELSNRPKRRALSLPVRRSQGTMTILKVLKKLFYVRKTGSTPPI